MPPSILLIGARSFIAQTLSQHAGVHSISHNAPDLSAQIEQHDVIINCAFHPSLRSNPYDPTLDVDTSIANIITGTGKRLIVMSSRMVYGPSADKLSETSPLNPQTIYARNKARIEQSCLDIIGEKACILRFSNIFGFEWPPQSGRKTFMSQILTSLKQEQKITFDISPKSEKDFLPVKAAADIIHAIATKQVGGIYNAGVGTSLSVRNVAAALTKGYGPAEIIYETDRLDSFYMGIEKLKTLGISSPSGPEILKEFETIGRKLATTGV